MKWVDRAGGRKLTQTTILNELNGRRKSLFITAASCELYAPPTTPPVHHRPRSPALYLLASEILNETEQIPLSPGFGIRNWQIIDKLFGACWLAKTNASRTLLWESQAAGNRYTFDWWTSPAKAIRTKDTVENHSIFNSIIVHRLMIKDSLQSNLTFNRIINYIKNKQLDKWKDIFSIDVSIAFKRLIWALIFGEIYIRLEIQHL